MFSFKNLSIPGGGFVSGILYSKVVKGLCYLRTDIGGAYRYCEKDESWKCLALKAGDDRICLTSPLSIAIDNNNPDMFYMACGVGNGGYLAVSQNRGDDFSLKALPVNVNGNNRGRSTGERLIIHKKRILFASQEGGLIYSDDKGETWTNADVYGLTDFTFIDEINGDILVLGSADGSVLISYDGESFERIETPEGFVATRCSFCDEYLYLCLNLRSDDGYYACESTQVRGGRVLRFRLSDGRFNDYEDISPDIDYLRNSQYGFGGIATEKNGHIVLSTVCCLKGDAIMISSDHGDSWKLIIQRNDLSLFSCSTPYMKPEYNGGTTVLHWITDIKLDPFSESTAMFNTGTGVFITNDIWGSGAYRDLCRGIEETVHMNVYSPPSGDVTVLDAVGDLGGFAFESDNTVCENSFTDEYNNRYITILNMDFPDENPSLVAATPRGNWTGHTKGGIIISNDGGRTWTHGVQPRGISKYIDSLISVIERPNQNAGFVAVSADGKAIVQTLCDVYELPADAVVYSDDSAKSWKKSTVYDLARKQVGSERHIRIYSDRKTADYFYGFGEEGRIYVSRDKGKSFYEAVSPLPKLRFDLPFVPEIRGESGRSGVFWLALKSFGLWRLEYIPETDEFSARRVTGESDSVSAVGIGKDRPDSSFHTLYIAGTIDSRYGFWRSFNDGETWELISDEFLFGRINSISGDLRTFGRFYIGSGSCGLIRADVT